MNLKLNHTQLASQLAHEEMPAAFVRQVLRKWIKAEAESREQHKVMFAEPLLCLDREVQKQIKKIKKQQKEKV